MPFDPNTSKIAVVVPRLTFKKARVFDLGDVLGDLIHNEPYIVSIAVDAAGHTQRQLDFNINFFPNTRPGTSVGLIGDGHLIYGPRNPGDYLVCSVLVMEKDQDVRDIGAFVKDLIQSEAAKLGMTALLAANPGATAIANALTKLIEFVAAALAKDTDDYLYHTYGVFLRDASVPYSVNREFTHGNEFVDVTVRVIPLEEHNRQGPPVEAMTIA